MLAVADDLGYRPNRSASLLKLRRTKHLGVTMSVRNAFHGELVEGIQAEADRAGYEIVLSTVTASHDESRAIETLLGIPLRGGDPARLRPRSRRTWSGSPARCRWY